MIVEQVKDMLAALSQGRIRYIGATGGTVSGAPAFDAFRRSRKDRYFYEPQVHPHPELIFGFRGNLEMYVNGTWEGLEPGTVWVFLPGAVHSERYIRRNAEYRMLWMVISREVVGFHVTAYSRTRGYHLVGKRLALKLPGRGELSELAGRAELGRDQLLRIHFQTMLMETLYRVIPHMDKKSNREAEVPYHSQAIEQVRSYLDEHFSRDVSLSELGRMVHYSPCHLNLLFRREIGVPIRQYVLKRRVLEAERLLRTTEMEVKQVAYAVGFGDPLYFSRMFRRVTGSPPSKRGR